MGRYYQSVTLPSGEPNPKRRRNAHASGPSGPSGRRLTKFARGDFIAWDGEGWTRTDTGRHVYTMLCNSVDDSPLLNPNGIPTYECLDYLVSVGEQFPKSIHIVFGGGYDVNMILGDCDRNQLERIHNGLWVTLGDYYVCYRSRKSFTVKDRRTKKGIVLWDVFGFFQSSFVTACEKYLGEDHAGLVEVRKQKKLRHTFDSSQIESILHYCLLECDLLKQLMQTLREYLLQADLRVRRWDGAGACAAALMQREHVQENRGTVPIEVMRAAQYAYAGGRMEVLRFGNVERQPIYHYDINSAYPAAMASLPSLASGKWHYARGSHDHDRTDTFTVYHVRWRFSESSMYPFFWRAHDNSIFFPRRGNGWYWSPEVNAALEAMEMGAIDGKIEILGSWGWESTSDIKPFAWIPELYEQRREWKRAGLGAEKVVKLAINSLYGKTAQHLGGTATESPRFHRLEWAGYITSATRAKLFRAAIPVLRDRVIIMTATDALYSTAPLDLPCSNKLGEWEAHTHDGITVVQSGVYWTLDDGEASAFCRGFDKGSLSRRKILAAWRKCQTQYDATLTRFVTMGTALVGGADSTRLNEWRQWRTVPRVLALTTDGTKRYDEINSSRWTRAVNPARGLMHTLPSVPAAQVVGQLQSQRFALPWIDGGARTPTRYLDGVPLPVAETEAYDSLI